MSRPPGKRAPTRQTSSRTGPPANRTYRPRSVPPRSGPSPIMVGILAGIGVGVALGLLVVAYLLGTNSRPAATVPPSTSSQSGAPTEQAQAQPTTGDEPPRMTLADF